VIALATKYPNVHIDTSAYAAHRYPPRTHRIRARQRRLQGLVRHQLSDTDPSRALEHIDSLNLDEETRDLFLGGNARRLFDL
jgi:predicted TIM-barrel fold metal-dependent hydrolase